MATSRRKTRRNFCNTCTEDLLLVDHGGDCIILNDDTSKEQQLKEIYEQKKKQYIEVIGKTPKGREAAQIYWLQEQVDKHLKTNNDDDDDDDDNDDDDEKENNSSYSSSCDQSDFLPNGNESEKEETYNTKKRKHNNVSKTSSKKRKTIADILREKLRTSCKNHVAKLLPKILSEYKKSLMDKLKEITFNEDYKMIQEIHNMAMNTDSIIISNTIFENEEHKNTCIENIAKRYY